MIPFLFGLGALGVGYLFYRLIRRLTGANKNDDEKSLLQKIEDKLEQNFSAQSSSINSLRREIAAGGIQPLSIDASGNETYRLPEKYEPIRPLFNEILAIVHQVAFSERKVSIHKKIGEEMVATNIPTGDIDIRRIEQLSDLPKALTSDLGAEDDIFYPKLASNQILMQQPIAYEGVYAEQFFAPRRIYRVSQDVSGSTKGDRIAWSRMLDYLLMRKARAVGADFLLTTFTDKILDSVSATGEDILTFDTANAFIDDAIRADGGTDINMAILDQLESIEKENMTSKAKQDAQIILVTDGTEDIEEKLIAEKLKENQVKLHTVILGKSHNQLKRVSDKYHFLDIPGIDT